MRISFDLDDTLICYGDGIECEPVLPLLLRFFMRDEPLRKGSRRLASELKRQGHEIWIYTTSTRSAGWIKWWLRFHGIRTHGIINQNLHAEAFGEGSLPTKQPNSFGIDLHVDDSIGVAREGERHGFNVCVVDPQNVDWVEQVLGEVQKRY